MGTVALICAVLGILVIGLSLGSIARRPNSPQYTRVEMKHADIAVPLFRRTQVRFFLAGVALLAVGVGLGLLVGK